MKPGPPRVLIFMGVTGCGKTTVARLFAQKTGATFCEGDDFHTPQNVAKMLSGIPLTDDDRTPWLLSLRKIVSDSLARNIFTVMTCSALKAKYRDQLQAGDARVQFICLTAPRVVIESRLKKRSGHYMPPALLDSQLTILEPPADAVTVDAEKSPEEIVAGLIQVFGSIRPE